MNFLVDQNVNEIVEPMAEKIRSHKAEAAFDFFVTEKKADSSECLISSHDFYDLITLKK
jgi:hypothetical protein